jgi:hypothetical protein
VQGVILDQFRQYVAVRFGFRAWTKALAAAGRPMTHHYALDETYPDQEFGLLAVKTAEVTSTPLEDLLEGFGEGLVPEMLRLYSYLVDPGWDYGDFLLHMEPILQKVLELHSPQAEPVKLHARRTGPQTLEIVYDSPVRVCAAVEGVIRGAAHEYRVDVELKQVECTLRGDRQCTFEIAVPVSSSSAAG